MIRITGGRFKGLNIQTPRGELIRPTLSRVRQALFNSIQIELNQAKVLDLFAGSGALGIEALSRGAKEVVFIESSRTVAKVLLSNLKQLNLFEKTELLNLPAQSSLKKLLSKANPLRFDLIFMDPPYHEGLEKEILVDWPWDQLLTTEGKLIVEWSPQAIKGGQLPETLAFLVKIREKAYGDTVLTTYQIHGAHSSSSDLSR